MNLQPQFSPYGGQLNQAPEYAYSSAPYAQSSMPSLASLGGVPSPNMGFEYGGGQKYAPYMGGGAMVTPTAYRSGGGMSAPLSAGSGKSMVTSNTSSKDPKALRARVFVGNLNTTTVSRDQLFQLYAPFGDIVAISVHKGFAFVQYAYESEARNAVSFTDGRMVGGRNIDVTISSEPKTSHSEEKIASKRSANVTITPTGYSDTKRPRLAAPLAAFKKSTYGSSGTPTGSKPVGSASKISTSIKSESDLGIDAALKKEILSRDEDIFICGACRQLFSTLSLFSEHKASNCQPPGIQISADEEEEECGNKNGLKEKPSHKPDGEPNQVQCFICHTPFDYSWNLLEHMSKTHNMTVYEVVNKEEEQKTAKTEAQ